MSSSEHETVPVAVISEFVSGDAYHPGTLMAGSLLGSASMTGAVKN